jgi:hypothetical protein
MKDQRFIGTGVAIITPFKIMRLIIALAIL